jgi:uncharacterized protein YjeT (DUF2065 family)
VAIWQLIIILATQFIMVVKGLPDVFTPANWTIVLSITTEGLQMSYAIEAMTRLSSSL